MTSAQCFNTTPVCSVSETCVPCNGDDGTAASAACPVTNPFCAASGACTRCTADSDCTMGTHAGAYCDTTTGACTTACQTDAECGAGNWCNSFNGAGVCQPQLPNGQGVTGQTCTSTLGMRACISGVCDTADNLCGLKNGDGPCNGGDGMVVCRSNVCAMGGSNMGLCEQCNTSADCNGLVCDPTTNTCVPEPDAGAPDAGMDSDTGMEGGAGVDGGGHVDSGEGSNGTDAGGVDGGDGGGRGTDDGGAGRAGESGGCSVSGAGLEGDASGLAFGGFGAALALGALRRRRTIQR